MKTELEKCLAGEPFYGGDPEIVKIAARRNG
ncbi:unknown [Prevotella sp. CAG:1124]|nr:unknown [Prevotella sp. CAG:1124]